MSLIKANAVQVGQSPTATQNFTLAVPSSPDGTIKLARGNSGATTQDVITVDALGNVSFAGTIPSGNISSSTAIATGSTTARSLANRFVDLANVKDFGAVGDGVTNDIAAFVLAADTGKQVFVPDGTYTITVSNQTQATSIMAMMSRLHLFCNALTINFVAGVFAFPSRTDFKVTNGQKLKMQGAAPTVLSYSSLGTVTSNGSQDHDVTIAVADASSVAASDYIIIRPATSAGIQAGDTTGPFGGIWKVTGVAGNNITFKNTSFPSSLTGATISCPTGGVRIVKMNTVLNYTGSNSIGFYINCEMGADSAEICGFKDFAIVGSSSVGDTATGIAGIYLEYGASVTLGDELGITSFRGNGVYALYSGIVNATAVVASSNRSNGFYALNGSSFQLVRAQSTGNGATGIASAGNSNVAASQSSASGNGGSGYLSSFHSSLIAEYGDSRFNDDDGFSSRDNGYIHAESGRAFNNGSRGVNTLRDGGVDFTRGSAGSNTLGNLVETPVSTRIAGSSNYSVPDARIRVNQAINFGSISANSVATNTITATGALIGDIVAIGYNGADVAGVIITGRVSASDTVTIYAANVTTGPVTLGNRTYYAAVLNRE